MALLLRTLTEASTLPLDAVSSHLLIVAGVDASRAVPARGGGPPLHLCTLLMRDASPHCAMARITVWGACPWLRARPPGAPPPPLGFAPPWEPGELVLV